MDSKMFIILLTTLLPAFVVGYVLRSNGKTINFAVVGATTIYVISVLMIYLSFFLAAKMGKRADDLVLATPLVVGAVGYYLLRGTKKGNE